MAEITTLDKTGLDFLRKEEGCRLEPYLDDGGIPTIGIGMTYYPTTGKKVTMQDSPITQAQADAYFLLMLKPYCLAVYSIMRDSITQNNFNALASLCYNIGTTGFKSSTVVRLANAGVIGLPLRDAFCMWNKIKHKYNDSLNRRRIREFNLYIS